MINYQKEYLGLIKALSSNSVENNQEVLSPISVQSKFNHIVAIIFEVTEGCNLNCEYCGYGDNYVDTKYRPRGRGAKLCWETAKPLIDYFLSLWNSSNLTDYYVSFYGGEPLLNIDIIQKITEYLEDNKSSLINIHYNLTTNGILLQKYIEFFIKHDFFISVSLDGDEESDIFRIDKSGKPSFQIVSHNLRTIQKKYPSYFASNMSFQAVVTRNSSVLEVHRFFDKQYGKLPLAIEVSTEGLVQNNNIHKYYLNLNRDIADSYSDNVAEYEKYNIRNPKFQLLEDTIRTLSFSYTNYYRLFDIDEKCSMKSPTCKPIGGRIFLSTTGLLYQCEKVKFDFPIGKIFDGRIMIDFEQLASKFNRIIANYGSQCHYCLHQLHCQHCIATSLGYSGDGNTCIDFEVISNHNIKTYVSQLRGLSKQLNLLLKR